MKTLKEIRKQLGIKQAEVAEKINVNIATYSMIEDNSSNMDIEDMMVLERNFDQKIKWTETLTDEQQNEALGYIETLCNHYPVQNVVKFAHNALKEGKKWNNPLSLLRFYAEQAERNYLSGQEPLLPPDVEG